MRTAVKLCLFSRWCRLLGPRRRGGTAADCTRGEEGEGPMLGGEAEVVGEVKEGSGLVTTEEEEEDDSICCCCCCCCCVELGWLAVPSLSIKGVAGSPSNLVGVGGATREGPCWALKGNNNSR